ncbi:MAG: undecaprenyldiphospho-muramoylpentapeptide beta-N-acetylglucosaminyltransferase [Firmicutes bacterium]|nr:undecaprenyldiphospho-muramoylpentapeptide beta-N-acetylglucosaminyltransferase [Bacillota bacterium]
MKKIVMTGGGTAGHITPNIALFAGLKAAGYEIYYIGEKGGMEEELIKKEGIPFYGITAGKMRRDKSVKTMAKNATDMFRVLKGKNQAKSILKEIKPDVVFSKGGFVTVPVVMAAHSLNIRIVCHESDMTPGLANKLALPKADKICVSFPETMDYVDRSKAVLTGSPVRESLFKGDRQKGLSLCGFSGDKPVIMVMCGSQGSVKINQVVRDILPDITKKFDLAHLCGKGNTADITAEGYKQFEYVNEELPDVFAAADMVISRAGANSISEFLSLKKPNLLIPLGGKATRGDQILNAESFEKQGFSLVLPETELTDETLKANIEKLYAEKDVYIDKMEKSDASDGERKILEVIFAVSGKGE